MCSYVSDELFVLPLNPGSSLGTFRRTLMSSITQFAFFMVCSSLTTIFVCFLAWQKQTISRRDSWTNEKAKRSINDEPWNWGSLHFVEAVNWSPSAYLSYLFRFAVTTDNWFIGQHSKTVNSAFSNTHLWCEKGREPSTRSPWRFSDKYGNFSQLCFIRSSTLQPKTTANEDLRGRVATMSAGNAIDKFHLPAARCGRDFTVWPTTHRARRLRPQPQVES